MSATSPDTQLLIAEADLEQDRATIISIWRTGFDNTSVQESKYDRQYLHNPFGKSCVFLLKRGDEVIGAGGLVAKQWVYKDKPINAVLFADLVVIPKYRTLGPAMLLVRHVLREAQQRYAFAYGFPNEKSAFVYARCDMNIKDRTCRYVKPLRLAHYLQRKLGLAGLLGTPVDMLMRIGSSIAATRYALSHRLEIGSDDFAAIDGLWQRSVHNDQMMEMRDSKYLQWRFGSSQHTRLACLYRRRTNQLVAYCVLHQDPNNFMAMVDFLCENVAADFPVLSALLTRHARQTGAFSLTLEFSGSEDIIRTIEACGFHSRDKHVLAHATGTAFPAQTTELNWYITSADRD